MTERQDNGVAAAMGSLYPFLYAGETHDQRAVPTQVRASTIAKAEEVLELRRMIARRDGARMARCAREMAARFAAGGRLFAFGNGGSATDAAQLATLFLNPGPCPAPHPAPCIPGPRTLRCSTMAPPGRCPRSGWRATRPW